MDKEILKRIKELGKDMGDTMLKEFNDYIRANRNLNVDVEYHKLKHGLVA